MRREFQLFLIIPSFLFCHTINFLFPLLVFVKERSFVSRSVAIIPEKPDTGIDSYLVKISNHTSECIPTTQVEIIEIALNDLSSRSSLVLNSFDSNGAQKVTGGDEFYVVYVDNNETPDQDGLSHPNNPSFKSSAVAVADDRGDGTYGLDFVRPPMDYHERGDGTLAGKGTLYFVFEYTCGFGRKGRPSKDRWENGGSLFRTYKTANVTFPIHVIRQPSLPKSLGLSTFRKVVCFGDSVIQNACGVHFSKSMFPVPKNFHVMPKNYGSYLSNSSLINATLAELHNVHGHDLKDKYVPTAIITGSAAWEAFGGNRLNARPTGFYFREGLNRNKKLLEALKKQYPNDTNNTIFWFGPSAVHLGSLPKECQFEHKSCVERVRYESNSILRYLNEQQQQLATSLNVEFVNVWETTYLSGSWHMNGDSIHYRRWLNEVLFKSIY